MSKSGQQATKADVGGQRADKGKKTSEKAAASSTDKTKTASTPAKKSESTTSKK